jgi:hypothetical protein
MHVCMVAWPTINSFCMVELLIKPLHHYALDGRVLSLELWIVSRWICIFYAGVGLSSLNPVLISLVRSYVDLPLSEPSLVIWWYSAFLLNLLKVDGIASLHSPYTMPCALWLHHIISINTQVHLNLEQECRYPIHLWVYPWQPHCYYLFLLFSTGGLCLWILNYVGITLEPPWTLLDPIVNPSGHLAHQNAPNHVTVSH